MTHKNGLEKPHVIKVVDNPTPEIWVCVIGTRMSDQRFMIIYSYPGREVRRG